jgi:hypothetical protein
MQQMLHDVTAKLIGKLALGCRRRIYHSNPIRLFAFNKSQKQKPISSGAAAALDATRQSLI